MAEKVLPTIGAAMKIEHIGELREWLVAGQRDLEIQDGIDPNFLDGDWSSAVAELKTLLDGHTGRVGIHGPFLNLHIAAIDPVVRERTNDLMKKGIAFAGEIDGTHMVIHSPFSFFGDAFAPYARTGKVQNIIEHVHTTLEGVVQLAESNGVTIMIETLRDKNPAPLLALVQSFNSDYVRLSIDTGHCMVTYHHGGASPSAWVDAAGSWLGHIHVQDVDGLADRHWPPGCGNINWYAFFEAVGRLEHTPVMVLEMPLRKKIERTKQGYEWLKAHQFVQ